MLNTPINNLPATSAQTIRKFKSLDINTYWDLLNYFPFRYEDYSKTTIKGKVTETKQLYTKKGLRIQKIIILSREQTIELSWFNQPYLLTILKPGIEISAAGEIKKIGRKLLMQPKEYEVLKFPSRETIHTNRIVPIYPEKHGLSSRTIREKIWHVLSATGGAGGGPPQRARVSKTEHWEEETRGRTRRIEELLPEKLISDNNLIDEELAYASIHFPQNPEAAAKAHERLSFDEFFIIQLSTSLIKKQWYGEKVINPFKSFGEKIQQFIKLLPFQLTSAQQKVTHEILEDLVKTHPMNRFLQGEVGSGKTVVAAIACYLASLNGYQTLFMAPTEILAQQHYSTLSSLLAPLEIKIALITSGAKTGDWRLQTENCNLFIGTHALIQKKLDYKKVGLVIVDEQQRFGVAQRAELKNKGLSPHLLTMTATPIPRTVALTIYGELDMSTIDEMPKGRTVVKTYLVPKHKRENCYKWIKDKINKKHIQIFIVCPLIDESEKETMRTVRAAKKEYEFLKDKIFKDFSVALLHGKLKSDEKNKIMSDFKNKKYDILVTTSVVEVGVDVPNATVMIVEGAERFGLAQLHQLRGRVGRGYKESYCFLFTPIETGLMKNETGNVISRLNFFASNFDGRRIAEYDLRRRGPGQIYGTAQHGYSNLKIATFTDYEIIEKSQRAVDNFLKNYRVEDYQVLKNRLRTYKTGLVSRD